MTSISDGKKTDNSLTSTTKLKTHYIQLYKSLEVRLTSESDLRSRTTDLCEAWRSIYALCQHSSVHTHPLLLSWIQRHTANTLLRTEWQSPKSADLRTQYEEVLTEFTRETESLISSQDGPVGDWEREILQLSRHYRNILADPWGHPVLRLLLDPKGEQPKEELLKEWVRQERGEFIVCRLRHLCASKCNDLALSLVTAVMSRTRTGVPCDDQRDNEISNETNSNDTEFATFLKTQAGFNTEVWDLMTDIELVLLHKMERIDQCIILAKQIPLRLGYHVVERLRTRLEKFPKEKKIWKNAKDIAILVVQLIIARCMVVASCSHACRLALYWCARALARLTPAPTLRSSCTQLAAPAVTARHLHTLATAVRAQCEDEMRPLVCELYVRAITAGGNELERLKANTEKESEAREMEKTICTWFVQLSSVLHNNERIVNECLLTAFSVHPSMDMYQRLEQAPRLAASDVEQKKHAPSDFSWASDSRSTKSAFVKTSETLNLTGKTQEATTLSTAILTEGEKLGLGAELCQDLAVLLGGPRVKTFSWDMGREELLKNCRGHVERTGGGTRTIRKELRYLNLEPAQFKHLKEDVDDDEDDVYYGIEKGYEYLLEIPEEVVHFDTDKVSVDWSSDSEVAYTSRSRRNKISSEDEQDSDPLSLVAEAKRYASKERKERPHSKERSKDTIKKERNTSKSRRKPRSLSREKHKEKSKKERKHKNKNKDLTLSDTDLTQFIGLKVTENKTEHTGKKVHKKTERRKEMVQTICPPITDSDYDSQGKSSITSSQGTADEQSNVQFDGLFSMDDFKTISPEKIIEQYTQEIRPSLEQKELNISTGSVHLTNNKEMSKVTPSRTPSGGYIPALRPTTSTVNDKVKQNITKLLQFRKQKLNPLQSTKILDPYKIYNSSSHANTTINNSASPSNIQKRPSKLDTLPSNLSMDYINKHYPHIQLTKAVNKSDINDLQPIIYKSSVQAQKNKLQDTISQSKSVDPNGELDKRPNALTKRYNAIPRSLSEKEYVENFLNDLDKTINFSTDKQNTVKKCLNISSNTKPTYQSAKSVNSQKKADKTTYSRLNYLHKNKMSQINKLKPADLNKTNQLHYEPEDLDVELAKFVKLNSDITYLNNIDSQNILNCKVQNIDHMTKPSIIPDLLNVTQNDIAAKVSYSTATTSKNISATTPNTTTKLEQSRELLTSKHHSRTTNKSKAPSNTNQIIDSAKHNSDLKNKQHIYNNANFFTTTKETGIPIDNLITPPDHMKTCNIPINVPADLKTVLPKSFLIGNKKTAYNNITEMSSKQSLNLSENRHKTFQYTYTATKFSGRKTADPNGTDKQEWATVMDKILSYRTPKREVKSSDINSQTDKTIETKINENEKRNPNEVKITKRNRNKSVKEAANSEINKEINVNKEILKSFIENTQINAGELPELDCDLLDDLLDNDLLQEISELTSDEETYNNDRRASTSSRKKNIRIDTQQKKIRSTANVKKATQQCLVKTQNISVNTNLDTSNKCNQAKTKANSADIPFETSPQIKKSVICSNYSVPQHSSSEAYPTKTNALNMNCGFKIQHQTIVNNNTPLNQAVNQNNQINTLVQAVHNTPNIIIPQINIVRQPADTVLLLRTNTAINTQPNVAVIQNQYVTFNQRPQVAVYQPAKYITYNNLSVANQNLGSQPVYSSGNIMEPLQQESYSSVAMPTNSSDIPATKVCAIKKEIQTQIFENNHSPTKSSQIKNISQNNPNRSIEGCERVLKDTEVKSTITVQENQATPVSDISNYRSVDQKHQDNEGSKIRILKDITFKPVPKNNASNKKTPSTLKISPSVIMASGRDRSKTKIYESTNIDKDTPQIDLYSKKAPISQVNLTHTQVIKQSVIERVTPPLNTSNIACKGQLYQSQNKVTKPTPDVKLTSQLNPVLRAALAQKSKLNSTTVDKINPFPSNINKQTAANEINVRPLIVHQPEIKNQISMKNKPQIRNTSNRASMTQESSSQMQVNLQKDKDKMIDNLNISSNSASTGPVNNAYQINKKVIIEKKGQQIVTPNSAYMCQINHTENKFNKQNFQKKMSQVLNPTSKTQSRISQHKVISNQNLSIQINNSPSSQPVLDITPNNVNVKTSDNTFNRKVIHSLVKDTGTSTNPQEIETEYTFKDKSKEADLCSDKIVEPNIIKTKSDNLSQTIAKLTNKSALQFKNISTLEINKRANIPITRNSSSISDDAVQITPCQILAAENKLLEKSESNDVLNVNDKPVCSYKETHNVKGIHKPSLYFEKTKETLKNMCNTKMRKLIPAEYTEDISFKSQCLEATVYKKSKDESIKNTRTTENFLKSHDISDNSPKDGSKGIYNCEYNKTNTDRLIRKRLAIINRVHYKKICIPTIPLKYFPLGNDKRSISENSNSFRRKEEITELSTVTDINNVIKSKELSNPGKADDLKSHQETTETLIKENLILRENENEIVKIEKTLTPTRNSKRLLERKKEAENSQNNIQVPSVSGNTDSIDIEEEILGARIPKIYGQNEAGNRQTSKHYFHSTNKGLNSEDRISIGIPPSKDKKLNSKESVILDKSSNKKLDKENINTEGDVKINDDKNNLPDIKKMNFNASTSKDTMEKNINKQINKVISQKEKTILDVSNNKDVYNIANKLPDNLKSNLQLLGQATENKQINNNLDNLNTHPDPNSSIPNSSGWVHMKDDIYVKLLQSSLGVTGKGRKFQQNISIRLSNGKLYAATVSIDKIVSTEELMESENFKNILSMLIRQAETLKHDDKKTKVRNLSVTSTFTRKAILSIVKAEKCNNNIETIDLLSDDEEPTFYKFTTEYGIYKINESISNELFLKHQKQFSMKCQVSLSRCDFINVLNVTNSQNCNQIDKKNPNIDENIITNTTDKNVSMVPDINVLRRNFFRDLVPLLTPKNTVIETIELSDTDSDDCKDNSNLQELQKSVLKQCFIKLIRCDDALRKKNENTTHIGLKNNNTKNDFLYDIYYEYPEGTSVSNGRTSPVMDVYDVLSFELQSNKYQQSECKDIVCDAEWFQNKKNISINTCEANSFYPVNNKECPITSNNEISVSTLSAISLKVINTELLYDKHREPVIRNECTITSSTRIPAPALTTSILNIINSNWQDNPHYELPSRIPTKTDDYLLSLSAKTLNVINSQWCNIEHYESMFKTKLMKNNIDQKIVSNNLKRKHFEDANMHIVCKNRKCSSVKFKSKNLLKNVLIRSREPSKIVNKNDLGMPCIYYFDYNDFIVKKYDNLSDKCNRFYITKQDDECTDSILTFGFKKDYLELPNKKAGMHNTSNDNNGLRLETVDTTPEKVYNSIDLLNNIKENAALEDRLINIELDSDVNISEKIMNFECTDTMIDGILNIKDGTLNMENGTLNIKDENEYIPPNLLKFVENSFETDCDNKKHTLVQLSHGETSEYNSDPVCEVQKEISLKLIDRETTECNSAVKVPSFEIPDSDTEVYNSKANFKVAKGNPVELLDSDTKVCSMDGNPEVKKNISFEIPDSETTVYSLKANHDVEKYILVKLLNSESAESSLNEDCKVKKEASIDKSVREMDKSEKSLSSKTDHIDFQNGENIYNYTKLLNNIKHNCSKHSHLNLTYKSIELPNIPKIVLENSNSDADYDCSKNKEETLCITNNVTKEKYDLSDLTGDSNTSLDLLPSTYSTSILRKTSDKESLDTVDVNSINVSSDVKNEIIQIVDCEMNTEACEQQLNDTDLNSIVPKYYYNERSSNSQSIKNRLVSESPEKIKLIIPHETYSYKPIKRIKRKLDIKEDEIITTKKFRNTKNIDVFKQSITECIKNTSIKNEFKKTIDYCNSVKFSFSLQYHDEYFEPEKILRNWPINSEISLLDSCTNNTDDKCISPLLFNDDSNNENRTLKQQTLLEEINEIPLHVDNNINVGFGERSGRVIKNITDGQLVFSAATLSDVKHIQPCIYSDDSNKYTNKDQAEKIHQHFYFINLRAKVKSFFEKSTMELHNYYMKKLDEEKKKNQEVNQGIQCLPGLYETEFMKPNLVPQIVQVVQVGQLPVSAAAQNPITCDSLSNQGTDNSPTQCVGQSPLNEDTPAPIGTSSEYTELTSANLNVPSARDLIEAHRHNAQSMTPEQIIDAHMSHTNKSHFHTVIKEIDTHIQTQYSENCEILHHQSERYDYSTNMHNQYSNNNIETSLISEQLMFGSGDQDSMDGSPSRHDNDFSEKSNQIANAMNAAGIASSDIEENTLDAISQELESHGFRSTDRAAPMSIQQALAQLLPPSMHQHISEECHESQTDHIAPQILRIVQNQQSVINSSNTTQVLHIVQNKNTANGSIVNGGESSNTFNGISLIDAGLQQGNQLLHIVNTGAAQKGQTAGQLLKRVNLLTNLANAQGSHEQKVVQFVCKSPDGKSLQVNTGHQRSMVLRLQPIETPAVQNVAQSRENSIHSPPEKHISTQDEVNHQDLNSHSAYEENYGKFVQNVPGEKSTSLPKFNQAFGKPVFEDEDKQNDINCNNSELHSSETPAGHSDSNTYDQHIEDMSSPLLLQKSTTETSQQLKQNVPAMNIQTMHGGVIYTRQIPVNIGGGQTINLITVPSTEMVDDNQQNNLQKEVEPSIIKIVPQAPAPNAEVFPEENNPHMITNDKAQQPSQPVLTQMRIKLPMLSKAQHVVHGGRVVRPSFLQIQRNLIGGANQPVYQQLVLTAAPGQTIRLPQPPVARTVRINSTENRSAEMSSSTLEQLREFDMVLEQVKERSTVQPEGSDSSSTTSKTSSTSKDSASTVATTAVASSTVTRNTTTQQVFYSIGGNQTINLAYINRKASSTAVTGGSPASSTYVRCTNSSSVVVTSKSKAPKLPDPPNLPKPKTKPRVRSRITHTLPAALKLATVPPKPITQKPLEDEQTTRRILYILAEYRDQVENSPDKNKPAPRRRNATPGPPMKRRRGGSGDDSPGSPSSPESSSISPSRIAELQAELASPHNCPRKVARKMHYDPELNSVVTTPMRTTPPALKAAIERNKANNARAQAVLVPTGCILPVSVMRGARLLVAPRPRLVLRPEEPAPPDRFSPDPETSKMFDKIFEDHPKDESITVPTDQPSVSQEQDGKKDGIQSYHRLVSSSKHKYTILDEDLQTLTEECSDLGMDSPSAADLFPEADLLFSPQEHQPHSQSQPQINEDLPPEHEIEEQITEQITEHITEQITTEQITTEHIIAKGHQMSVEGDVNEALVDEEVGVVTVSEDEFRTIAVDHEEFARAHPNTTFHSEEDVDNNDVYTIRDIRGRHITSTIFHSVISQAQAVRYTDIDNIIDSIPGPEPPANATHVIRRVCYEDDRRYLMDENEIIAGNDARMGIGEDTEDGTTTVRNKQIFWENEDSRCRSPYLDETTTDSTTTIGSHMRLDSVIKEARRERLINSECFSTSDESSQPPIRTYPAKRTYHNMDDTDQSNHSTSGKTRAGESSECLESKKKVTGKDSGKKGTSSGDKGGGKHRKGKNHGKKMCTENETS